MKDFIDSTTFTSIVTLACGFATILTNIIVIF